MPHLLACPDKFKGTATAQEMSEAMAEAGRSVGWTASAVPLADGGEGTLDVLGGPNRRSRVTGPLGQPVEAEWRLDGDQAVVEMARASGLALVGGAQGNRPMDASTRGTGELILAAIGSGARHVTVCLGGSATTDGGLGAVEVLEGRLSGVNLRVACDVTTSFQRAATDFAPQKGATPAQAELLARRLGRLAQLYRDRYGVDVETTPGAGAAGGLAGGLAALGARLVPGFDLVAEAVDLEEHLERVDMVVTGEGFLDEQSLQGKVVGGLVELCAEFSKPLLVVVGEVLPEVASGRLGRHVEVVSLSDRFGPDRSLADPVGSAAAVVKEHLTAL